MLNPGGIGWFVTDKFDGVRPEMGLNPNVFEIHIVVQFFGMVTKW